MNQERIEKLRARVRQVFDADQAAREEFDRLRQEREERVEVRVDELVRQALEEDMPNRLPPALQTRVPTVAVFEMPVYPPSPPSAEKEEEEEALLRAYDRIFSCLETLGIRPHREDNRETECDGPLPCRTTEKYITVQVADLAAFCNRRSS